MNILIFLAAVVSLFAVIGHFAMGTKMYLKPVLDSKIDIVPKQVMRSLFHYMSAFMLLSTYVLFEAGFGWGLISNSLDVILYTGIIYGGLALVQILVSLSSGIKGGLFKLFQWVFWLLISVLSILGTQI